MNREEMIEKLIEKDIENIKMNMANGDYEFLDNILRGEGFTPYNQLTDEEIKQEFDEEIEDELP